MTDPRRGKYDNSPGWPMHDQGERDMRALAALRAERDRKPRVREPIYMWQSPDRAEMPGMHRLNEAD